MFDRVVVIPGKTHTEYVTREVHEHRAPTDESVRLLREMEAKAETQVDQRIRVEANEFKAVVEVAESMVDRSRQFVCRFSLNGSRHKVRADTGVLDGPEVGAQKLADAVAAEISRQIAPAFIETMAKGGRR